MSLKSSLDRKHFRTWPHGKWTLFVSLAVGCILLVGCAPIVQPIAHRVQVNKDLAEAKQKASSLHAELIEKAKSEKGCRLGVTANPKTLILRNLGSNARRAGLIEGDRVLAVNGKIVTSKNEFIEIMKSSAGDSSINLTVMRDNNQLNLKCPCLSGADLYNRMAEAMQDASVGKWHACYSKINELENEAGPKAGLKAAQAFCYSQHLLSEGKNPDTDSTLAYLIYEMCLLDIQEESYSTESLERIRPKIGKMADDLKKGAVPHLAQEIQNDYDKAFREAAMHKNDIPVRIQADIHDSKTPSPASDQDGLPKLISKIQPSVVTIYAATGGGKSTRQGSGFFINNEGHLVTNYHVIKGYSEAIYEATDGKMYPITAVIAQDPQGDLAILATIRPEIPQLGIPFSTKPAKVGEKIVVIGSPLGLEQTASDGIISAIREIPNIGKVYQITAPISRGSSGSPVVNMNGELVGIATMVMVGGQNLNFAISGERILALVKNAQSKTTAVQPEVTSTAVPVRPADADETGKTPTPVESTFRKKEQVRLKGVNTDWIYQPLPP